jgi:hypothetical protein
MIRSTRGLRAVPLALLASLALGLLAPALSAAEGVQVEYKPESETAFAQQLAGGQVRAVTVNKRIRTLRVTLRNGSYVLARYPAHQEPRVVAQLKAKGVLVTVLGRAAAEKAAKKPVHHKLRYIAAAILVVVIAIVGAVLLINRRRGGD